MLIEAIKPDNYLITLTFGAAKTWPKKEVFIQLAKLRKPTPEDQSVSVSFSNFQSDFVII